MIVKFKKQCGNIITFEDSNGAELSAVVGGIVVNELAYHNISITKDLTFTVYGYTDISSIQTAVKLMQVLIKEGLV